MSRLGKKAIDLPQGVEVDVKDLLVTVKGPKGELSQVISDDIEVQVDGDAKQILLVAKGEGRQTKANHGLYRSLIQNMVTGASVGFVKSLLLEGVGYRVVAVKNKLTFSLGFCHPIDYFMHPEMKCTLDGNTKIKLESSDKQLLGQVASEIRALRKPEPYKGKGVRYSDEVIRKKIGKAASK
jgi:large subunit ribosomal protein L6